MLHILVLLGCAVAIYFSSELFVNAIEWLGSRLKMGEIAVGSVLAALGTALPESIVTLIAVLGNSKEEDGIAMGAALGGPLVVGTLAYSVTGFLLLRNKFRAAAQGQSESHASNSLKGVDLIRLAADQRWFLIFFVAKVSLGLVAFAIKPWCGVLFFAAYAAFVRRELRATGSASQAQDLEPLTFQSRRPAPALYAILAQTGLSLGVVYFAAHLFVDQLQWTGRALGLPATTVALLLSPVATELPEIMNAVIWVRQGKVQLALANISGSMMVQATVPTGIGLLFTPWKFDTPILLAGIATLITVVYLQFLVRARGSSRTRQLTAGGLAAASLGYVGFAVALAVTGG